MTFKECLTNKLKISLAFFREKRKGMILRFSYDLEGKGLEKEPGSIRLVEEHMQQIVEVIRVLSEDTERHSGNTRNGSK